MVGNGSVCENIESHAPSRRRCNLHCIALNRNSLLATGDPSLKTFEGDGLHCKSFNLHMTTIAGAIALSRLKL